MLLCLPRVLSSVFSTPGVVSYLSLSLEKADIDDYYEESADPWLANSFFDFRFFKMGLTDLVYCLEFLPGPFVATC